MWINSHRPEKRTHPRRGRRSKPTVIARQRRGRCKRRRDPTCTSRTTCTRSEATRRCPVPCAAAPAPPSRGCEAVSAAGPALSRGPTEPATSDAAGTTRYRRFPTSSGGLRNTASRLPGNGSSQTRPCVPDAGSASRVRRGPPVLCCCCCASHSTQLRTAAPCARPPQRQQSTPRAGCLVRTPCPGALWQPPNRVRIGTAIHGFGSSSRSASALSRSSWGNA